MEGQFEGQQFGRYLVRQRLGGGGVATVYEAYDQVSGQSVALKVLPPNPDSSTLGRFKREASVAGSLRHPNIVRILQVGTAGDWPFAYIAMDLIEGESLAALLERFGKLRPGESSRLLEPIARALAFAHEVAVVHRDVKPSNILLRPVNRRLQPSATNGITLECLEYPVIPLLSDFGIARYLDAPELTNEGRTVGTPAFMAPEQCRGSRDVDGRADIYSLGTVLYRCVAGKLPFSGSTTQILHAQVFDPVVLDDEILHSLPVKVVEILQRSLAKAPEDRYQGAAEMADDLALVEADAIQQTVEASSDATATLTLETTKIFVQPSLMSTGSTHILVPGTAEIAVSPANSGAPKQKQRAKWSLWTNVAWGVFFAILIGAILWNVRGLTTKQQEEEPLTLPLIPIATYTPTAIAASSEISPVVTTVTATPAAAIQAPVTVTVLAATTTPLPTETPLPTLAGTATPNEALPEETSTETPLPIPTFTPVVQDVITPTEPMAGACVTTVDEFFIMTFGLLSNEVQNEFGCPTKNAELQRGEWLPFTLGTMVALQDVQLVYVYYADGTWEQVATGGAAEPFSQLIASDGRDLSLGEALQDEPTIAETVVQPFVGGVLIGNRSDRQILLLSRSKLRF